MTTTRTPPFLAACRREATPHTPVWFMRQAGRYMPEYRAVKERCGSILNMVKQPEVAAEITLQPIRAFPLDAAIIFADILTLLEPMGLRLEFIKGEGPLIHNPISSTKDIDALKPCPPAALQFTLDAIKLVKRELGPDTPLIGFSGAPFTLACYAIEGGASRDFQKAKRLMYTDPGAWHALMDRLAVAIGDYLAAQVDVGCDAVQLFDSWAGALSPDDYREFVLPHSTKALAIAVRKKAVPRIHFGTGTGGWLDLIRDAGTDVVGVDWRIDLADAWDRIGPNHAVQGNMDPVILFSTPAEIRRQAGRILERVKGRRGHIFNLGHGILEHTPVENVRLLAAFVREMSASAS